MPLSLLSHLTEFSQQPPSHALPACSRCNCWRGVGTRDRKGTHVGHCWGWVQPLSQLPVPEAKLGA